MIFSKGKPRSMRIDKKKSDILGETAYISGTNGMLSTMFDVQIVSKKDRIHQSEMPLSLCEQILNYVTYEREVILDQFAGGGTVGEVDLNLKRNCILIELIKENVDKIKERLGSKVYFEVVLDK